ncbi:TPA: hypothetical protein ACT5B2_005944 [Burkholderia cenocepacia]|uniref:hypothetical protein n=1 Tax=Burkholderia cepacia complex TaxID=87882 RepID=UPI0005B8D05D|nr:MULTISPECIES: hypothetical protein [Burkholderia cepacia complex]MDI9685555.1 hypothetical protein [Burkholderia cenocepacia]MDN7693015.1 hypothetical protein [Burkholderia cenocepacia]MDS0848448.1 hypothetical protein [Burkholderia cenocepacia]MEB2607652.1 hypothetical protein [Burkholderia cenocepacia]
MYFDKGGPSFLEVMPLQDTVDNCPDLTRDASLAFAMSISGDEGAWVAVACVEESHPPHDG